MLITARDSELTVHSKLMGGDHQVWRDIHLNAESPYFMVIYSVREGNSRIRQTSLSWREEDLVALCDQIEADPSTGMIRVCLLSPPWMNGSHMWRIDPIREIWDAVHYEGESSSCYVLENTNRLMNSRISPQPADWQTTDRVFLADQYKRFNAS